MQDANASISMRALNPHDVNARYYYAKELREWLEQNYPSVK